MREDPNEFSFAGFAEEENKHFETARLKRAKETKLDENFAKEIINHIYYNIGNIRMGEKLDHSTATMPVMSDECEAVIKALEPFEHDKESPFSPKNLDLFPFLVAYDKARSRVKLKKQVNAEVLDKIMAELESKKYGQPYQDLAVKLEILSASLNKDVVKDMIGRNNLEMKASDVIEKISTLRVEVFQYAKVWDEINKLMDKYSKLTDIKFDSKDLESATNIKKQLDEILEIELVRLENNEFEYGKMKPGAKVKYREKLLKIKTIKPEQIFDVDNFGFIGLLLETRRNTFSEQERKYERLNKRIEKYFA